MSQDLRFLIKAALIAIAAWTVIQLLLQMANPIDPPATEFGDRNKQQTLEYLDRLCQLSGNSQDQACKEAEVLRKQK